MMLIRYIDHLRQQNSIELSEITQNKTFLAEQSLHLSSHNLTTGEHGHIQANNLGLQPSIWRNLEKHIIAFPFIPWSRYIECEIIARSPQLKIQLNERARDQRTAEVAQRPERPLSGGYDAGSIPNLGISIIFVAFPPSNSLKRGWTSIRTFFGGGLGVDLYSVIWTKQGHWAFIRGYHKVPSKTSPVLLPPKDPRKKTATPLC